MGFGINTKLLEAGQSFEITPAYNCTMFSIQVSAGTGDNGTYIGNLKDPVTGEDSVAIPLTAGQGQVFVGENPQKPVSGITVSCIAGTIAINIGY